MVNGRELYIAIGGGKMAASKSCVLSMDAETIEVCSPMSGPARDYLAGKTTWSVTANGLCVDMLYSEQLMNIFNSRKKVRIIVFDKDENMKRVGDAIITSLQFSGSVGDLATYSASLKGCGELVRPKEEVDVTGFSRDEDCVLVVENGETNVGALDGAAIIYGMVRLEEDSVLEIVCPDGYTVIEGDDQIDQAIYNQDNPIDEHIIRRFYIPSTVMRYLAGEYYFAISMKSRLNIAPCIFVYS